MTEIDTDKLRALDERARRTSPAQAFRQSLLKAELVSMVPAILAMAEENARMREALEHCAECDPESAMFAARALGKDKA